MLVINRITKILLAFSLSLMLIVGAGGIIAEKHICLHCGTDFDLALFAIEDSNPDTCCETDSRDEDASGSCEMEEESCCSYETINLDLSEQLPYSIQNEEIAFSLTYFTITDLFLNGTDLQFSIIYTPPDNPGGRNIVILNSQYRT